MQQSGIVRFDCVFAIIIVKNRESLNGFHDPIAVTNLSLDDTGGNMRSIVRCLMLCRFDDGLATTVMNFFRSESFFETSLIDMRDCREFR